MRLTLRTLLAWLDDTLQPAQVREIGSQVAGSPFAQELTDRIHRVTRQPGSPFRANRVRMGSIRTSSPTIWITSSMRRRSRNTKRSAFLMT